jgi:hypothetical protein
MVEYTGYYDNFPENPKKDDRFVNSETFEEHIFNGEKWEYIHPDDKQKKYTGPDFTYGE